MDAYAINTFDLADSATARLGNTTLAASAKAKLMHESVIGNMIYFPKDDVRTEALIPSTTRTFCPFKGTASYWSAVLPNGEVVEDVGWSYERPLLEAKPVGGYIAFDTSKVEVSGEVPEVEATEETDAATDLTDWLLWQALYSPEPEIFIKDLADRMVAGGVPLRRLNVINWTLHPETLGRSFTWWRETGELTFTDMPMGPARASLLHQ